MATQPRDGRTSSTGFPLPGIAIVPHRARRRLGRPRNSRRLHWHETCASSTTGTMCPGDRSVFCSGGEVTGRSTSRRSERRMYRSRSKGIAVTTDAVKSSKPRACCAVCSTETMSSRCSPTCDLRPSVYPTPRCSRSGHVSSRHCSASWRDRRAMTWLRSPR